ncbi:MAG TPA: hypothetical protein VMQ40_07425 [Acidimicrobiales bacterium]|nr:hypothetical protein [Acidimicrobiales bacterium]
MTDDAAEATSVPERTGFLSRFAPKPSGPLSDQDLRGRMRTLDPLERKWGFGVGAVPLLVALILMPRVLHNTPGTAPWRVVNKHCLKPGHLVGGAGSACVVNVTFTPGHYALEFGLLVVLGAVIMFAVWKSMRVLAAVASIFSGLATGLVGLLAILYGAWLLLRSWRLQRYGVTDGASVRKVATERASERRAAKKLSPSSSERRESKRSAASIATTGTKPVTSSKRYTPKAKPRKR